MSTLDSRIRQWSTTPASNGTSPNIVPYGWPEGMAPSEVNDTARQQMTDHRYQWEDAEWFAWGDTVSKASATTFKIATDVTSRYLADRRIKIFDTATAYATILSSSYSAPDTTISLQFDNSEESLGASFTAVALAILTPLNPSIPRNFMGSSSAANNIIIGGNFDTNPWQRGTSFTSVANGTKSADRFVHNQSGGGVVSYLKTADAPTTAQAGFSSSNCLHVDVTTADGSIGAAEYYFVEYAVEGYDIAMAGFGAASPLYITLSFWHKHTKTGVYTVAFQNSATDRSYIVEYTQDVADTWEKANLTIQADTTGTWLKTNGAGLYIFFTMAMGANYLTTANTWTAGNFISTSNQVNNMDSTSNNFKLALVKLEIGQIASAYPVEHFDDVYKKCLRYYQKTFPLATAPAQATAVYEGSLHFKTQTTNGALGAMWQLPVPLRISTATPVFYSPISANATWYNTRTAGDSGTASATYTSDKNVHVANPGVGADTTGDNFYVHASIDAEI